LGHLAGGDSPRGSPWNGCGWAAVTLNGVVNDAVHNLATVTPSSLPEIDAVEVVSLRGLDANRVSDYMAIAKEARRVRIVGAHAQYVSGIWRALPEGKQKRCHTPPFGLRFFVAGDLVCEASICWQCNNIFGKAGPDKVFFEFNGSLQISRQLLAVCEAALGEFARE
jgi:hypothetical protein